MYCLLQHFRSLQVNAYKNGKYSKLYEITHFVRNREKIFSSLLGKAKWKGGYENSNQVERTICLQFVNMNEPKEYEWRLKNKQTITHTLNLSFSFNKLLPHFL